MLGPGKADICILCDYPSTSENPFPNFGAEGKFRAIFSSIGLHITSCTILPFLAKAPPFNPVKKAPDFGMLVKARKTSPGTDWEHYGGAWVQREVLDALAATDAALRLIEPRLVVTLGPAALWALTGELSTLSWRGSRLTPANRPFTVLPTFHPRTAAAQPALWHDIRADLTRVKNIYENTQKPREYSFKIAPSFVEARDFLENLLTLADTVPLKLSGDLETRSGHIACFGIAPSADEAFCIPFLRADSENPFYWALEEETLLVSLCLKLFRHPNILWIGQNFLYDCQYFYRHWGAYPIKVRDTMIGHHSLYSTSRKSLDYLSSLYCADHIYWKDEIKDWDPALGEKQFWTYNCIDAARTWEIDEELLKTARAESLAE